MFQGDPGLKNSEKALETAELGMEARSILKSIRTEDAKLAQALHLTRSDLHYFRARFNYYRLSLMRLSDGEREGIEPVLSSFYEKIVAKESQWSEGDEQQPPTPFLAPVEDAAEERAEPTPSSPENKIAEGPAEGRSEKVSSSNSHLITRLSLLKVALQAPPSKENNDLMAKTLDELLEEYQQ